VNRLSHPSTSWQTIANSDSFWFLLKAKVGVLFSTRYKLTSKYADELYKLDHDFNKVQDLIRAKNGDNELPYTMASYTDLDQMYNFSIYFGSQTG
jgi:hypothetical protein